MNKIHAKMQKNTEKWHILAPFSPAKHSLYINTAPPAIKLTLFNNFILLFFVTLHQSITTVLYENWRIQQVNDKSLCRFWSLSY